MLHFYVCDFGMFTDCRARSNKFQDLQCLVELSQNISLNLNLNVILMSKSHSILCCVCVRAKLIKEVIYNYVLLKK